MWASMVVTVVLVQQAEAMCSETMPKTDVMAMIMSAGGVAEYPGAKSGHPHGCDECDTSAAQSLMEKLGIAALARVATRAEFYRSALVQTATGECRFAEGGLEVGALHNPAPVGAACQRKMVYVDQVPAAELAALYPELGAKHITNAALLDDANTLSKVRTASRGFVVASHVIEHMPHTLFAVESWLRVLVPGGLALITAPYMCLSFDKNRFVTRWQHFYNDYTRAVRTAIADAPFETDAFWFEHLEEWTVSHLHQCTDRVCFDAFNATHHNFARTLGTFKRRGGMHFHTWTRHSWVIFWERAHRLIKDRTPFTVQGIGFNGLDMYVVLEKLADL